MSLDFPPLFLLGIPRSGTTLLLSLLDGHPQLLVDVGEARFFNSFYPRSRKASFPEQVNLANRHLLHMFDPQGAYYRNFLTHIPHETVRARFNHLIAQSSGQPKDFLETYVRALGETFGNLDECRYWVIKTPGNEFHLDKITRWWSGAYFIHMLRDPRDVYASYLSRDRRSARQPTTLDAFAYAWSKSARYARLYREMVGSQRYKTLRYGDLVSDPQACLADLVRFLGIADHPILHQPTKGAGCIPWGGNAADGSKTFQVHASSHQKWRDLLTEDQVSTLERLLYSEMRWVGYAPHFEKSQHPLPLAYRLKSLFRDLRFQIRYP